MSFPSLLYTTSTDKLGEWQRIYKIIGKPHAHLEILQSKKKPLIEVQTLDIIQLGSIKAIDAFVRMHGSALVEDVSIGFDALGGWPGPYYADAERALGCGDKILGRQRIHGLLDGNPNRDATVTIAIAYVEWNDVCVALYTEKGTVPTKLAGDSGFGWDPMFIPQKQQKTYAEMTESEKDACSFRNHGIQKLFAGDVQRIAIADTLMAPYWVKR